MEPVAERLHMYGAPSDAAPLDWAWVDDQLTSAGTYWVASRGEGVPHPRPVWGVWTVGTLHLSVGSAVIARRLTEHEAVAVHLDSSSDVVIVEGRVAGQTDDPDVLDLYNTKYDWRYTSDQYGPLTVIAASVVLAWRSSGWAGRDGFEQAGRWRF